MRKIVILSNYIYYALVKKYLIFAGAFTMIYHVTALIILPLLRNKPKVYTGESYFNLSFLPYELILNNSGVFLVFLIGFAGLFLSILKTIRNCYTKSKSIYTLLTLPMPREHVYLAFLLSGITAILTFLAFQLFLFLLWYFPVMAIGNDMSMQTPIHLPDGGVVRGYSSMVSNGLFLAFVRNPFFRVFYPLNFLELFRLILPLALVLTATLYIALDTGNRLFRGIAALVSIFLAVRILLIRALENRALVSMIKIHTFYIAACMSLIVLFIYLGIRKLNKAENL